MPRTIRITLDDSVVAIAEAAANARGLTLEVLTLQALVREATEHGRRALTADDPHRVYLKGRNYSATGTLLTDKRLRVNAGATIAPEASRLLKVNHPGYHERREELIASGVIQEKKKRLELVADVVFRSPSEAVSVIAGRAESGPSRWRLEASGVPIATILEPASYRARAKPRG